MAPSADYTATETTSAQHGQPSGPSDSHSPGTCAKLVALNKVGGKKEVLLLEINKPITIGRNPALCSYVLSDAYISNVHCKLYAVHSSAGEVIVSCQDLSTNGFTLNGHKVRKSSVILMHGDVIELPSSKSFKCVHLRNQSREKTTIFDPTPPTQPSHKTVGSYIVTSHSLGSGSFATVHLAMDHVHHRQVACKIIKARSGKEIGSLMKEVDILAAVHHPNICRVLDVEENDRFLHIFLELCTGGDLFTYITSHVETEGRLCEGEAKYIMYQLLKGLNYLHSKAISHRENLLLYAPGPYPRIQIADFGLARPRAFKSTVNVCGTIPYLPPEGVLALDNKELKYVGMPADCWSAGIVLYIMLSGTHPFDRHRPYSTSEYDYDDGSQGSSASDMATKQRIVRGQVEFPAHIWDQLPAARALIRGLLRYSYESRSTARMALESVWINCDIDALEEAYRERISRA